jgi:hypothetical protein
MMDLDTNMKCIVKPWFEAQLTACGLTAEVNTVWDQGLGNSHICTSGLLYNVNSHMHHIVRADWGP